MKESLRTRRQFALVYDRGRKAVGTHLVAFALTPPEDSNPEETRDVRVGIVASRRVGNAVRRNRAKRLLRDAWREHRTRLEPPLWVVLVARSRAADRDTKSAHVVRELESLFARLDLIRNG